MAAKKTTSRKSTGKKSTRRKAAPKKTAAKKPLSQMAAAEKVLAGAKQPMTCKAMVEAMAKKGLWQSPGGKTPEATLYAALLRHIRKHGEAAKFVKVNRGLFALNK